MLKEARKWLHGLLGEAEPVGMPASLPGPEPLTESPATVAAEPAKPRPLPQAAGQSVQDVIIRRSRKIYKSNAERQRAYRERLALRKAAAAKEPAPIVASEPIIEPEMMVKEIAATSDQPIEVVPPSTMPAPVSTSRLQPNIPWPAMDTLLQRGPEALPAGRSAVEPVVKVEPLAPPMPPINWDEELRTDLPPRSPEHIARLLEVETPEQTAARIWNDKMRVLRQRGYSVFTANQQACIIPSGTKYSGRSIWVRR